MSTMDLPLELARAPELNPAALPLGTVVGSWCIRGWRGRGAYGCVYRAARIGREHQGPVALKLALTSLDERFEREGDLLSRIHHPNVPQLLDRGWLNLPSGAFPYLVMEWIEGVNLYDWAARHNPSSRQALSLLAQVARALEATHAQGGVHRDLKGDNVLVRVGDSRPYLTDFGVGDYQGAPTLTWGPLPPGTRRYRSPQAWRFRDRFSEHPRAHYEPGPTDDLFALGVTAYRLVTDEYPPPTDTDEEDSEVWRPNGPGPRSPLARNARVLPELSSLILRMLALEPKERFGGSAGQAAEALEQAARTALAAADEPLFEWETADRALWTTAGEDGPPGMHWKNPQGHRPRRRDPAVVKAAQQQDEEARAEAERREEAEQARTEDSPEPPRSPAEVPRDRTLLVVGLVLALLLAVALMLASRAPTTHRVGTDGQELARRAKHTDAVRGAAPEGAFIPAPVADATQHEEDTSMKSSQQQNRPDAGVLMGVAATVCIAAACATTPEPPQPYKPPPESCPAGAVENMRALGFELDDPCRGTFQAPNAGKSPQFMPIKEGPITVYFEGSDCPAHGAGRGRVFFGGDRIYGRITQYTPESGGRTVPVCFDMHDSTDLSADISGANRGPGSTSDRVLIFSNVRMRPVEKFE